MTAPWRRTWTPRPRTPTEREAWRIRGWFDREVASCADEAVQFGRYRLDGVDIANMTTEIVRRARLAQERGVLPREWSENQIRDVVFASMKQFFHSWPWRKLDGAIFHDDFWGPRTAPPTRKNAKETHDG